MNINLHYPVPVHHEQRSGHDVYYFDQRGQISALKKRKTLDLDAIADEIIRSGERRLSCTDDEPDVGELISVERGGTVWSGETGRASYTEAAVAVWLADIRAVAIFARRIWITTPWTQVIAAIIDDWASPYVDNRYGYARHVEARRMIADYARAHIQAAKAAAEKAAKETAEAQAAYLRERAAYDQEMSS
jgi:hypothetical protein